MAVWVRFGVQLDYSCRLKSVSATAEKRVMSEVRRQKNVPIGGSGQLLCRSYMSMLSYSVSFYGEKIYILKN